MKKEVREQVLSTLTATLAESLNLNPSDKDFEDKVNAVANSNQIVQQIQTLRQQVQDMAKAEYAKAKVEVVELFRKLGHSFTDLIHYASEAGEDTKNLEKIQSQLVKLKTQANFDIQGLRNDATEEEEEGSEEENTQEDTSTEPAKEGEEEAPAPKKENNEAGFQ